METTGNERTRKRLLWVALLLPILAGCDGTAPPVEDGAARDGAGESPRDLSLVVDRPDIGPRLDRGDDPCARARDAVIAEISRINYCAFEGECVSMPGTCPFDCYIVYNRQEDAATLTQLIASYRSMAQCLQCEYDCALPGPIVCSGGRCEMEAF